MTLLLSALALVGVVLPVFAPTKKRWIGRRLFWAGLALSVISAFFIAYPPDWKSGSLLALTAAVLIFLNAYFNTSHLKFRGKIYAFGLEDSQPDPSPANTSCDNDSRSIDPAPDSYGGMATTKKTWWLMVCAMVMCTLCVAIQSDDKPAWLASTMVLIGAIFAAGLGYGDASWGYKLARGQRLQFVIVSLITAGVFAVIYLAAYRMGIRRPLRRKQSMEYRAHAHLRKKYP